MDYRFRQPVRYLLLVCAVSISLLGIACLAAPLPRQVPHDVETTLAAMSVEEKAGQIMIGWFQGQTLTPDLAARIKNLHLGGVILYQWSEGQNVTTTTQLTSLIRDIQTTAVQSRQIPLFIAIDQENGWGNLFHIATTFPTNMGLAAGGSEEAVGQAAAVTARELRQLGITVNFAPVVDVNNNPANPIISVRSFGSNAADVIRYASQMLPVYEHEQVLAFAKHFPGHGDTNIDTHVGLPRIEHSRQHLEEVEFAPFRAMINQGIPGIMSAHVVLPAIDSSGTPATLSPTIIGLLRQEMHFDGLVATDALNMGALMQDRSLEEASVEALGAGVDLLVFGADANITPQRQEKVHQALVAAVKTGRIPQDRLDEAVRRILTYKQKYNILSNPFPASHPQVGLANDALFAKKLAQSSITLVKDEQKLLPLPQQHKTPIILPINHLPFTFDTLAAAPFLQPYYLPANPSTTEIQALAKKLQSEPIVIIPTWSNLTPDNWFNVMQAFDGKKIVALALWGPYDLLQYPQVSTYLTTYISIPSVQEALLQVLSGQADAKGHLPVDIPGLYPRGSGLTTNP